MGELIWPTNGSIYLDANCFIYSIEKIDPYRTILDTLWKAISDGQVTVITSELTFLEVLVKPLKEKDMFTAAIYRIILRHSPGVHMIPVTQTILENAANLRADLNLKTPDAIHAATAILQESLILVTNDNTFRRVPDLKVMVLNEIALQNKDSI